MQRKKTPQKKTPPENLQQLLDALAHTHAPREDREHVTIGGIVESIGRRSFGPLLLVAGLLAVSPLTGIPGMPTTLGILVALIAGQLLLGRKRLWLPHWLENRRLGREALAKAIRRLRRPACVVDRFLEPRLEGVTRRGGLYTIALICTIVGVAMPPLELVPFSAHIAGLAITAFGLALIAHDGLVGLIALTITAGICAFAAVRIVL